MIIFIKNIININVLFHQQRFIWVLRTAITMDENVGVEATQEEISENIKLHKEVLSNVKMQPWNMRKKLKLVMQAKAYIKKHEGVLQERLAQSHSTKDMLARWNILIIQASYINDVPFRKYL